MMFAPSAALGGGGDLVELYYFGRAHTGGDTGYLTPDEYQKITGLPISVLC
jgi:hypothetical protein